MFVSRLSFYTRPGRTEEVAQRLKELADMIVATGLPRPRILRISMASPGAPDLQFEEEFNALSDLERSMERVVSLPEFSQWSRETSERLLHPPKRELLTVE